MSKRSWKKLEARSSLSRSRRLFDATSWGVIFGRSGVATGHCGATLVSGYHRLSLEGVSSGGAVAAI